LDGVLGHIIVKGTPCRFLFQQYNRKEMAKRERLNIGWMAQDNLCDRLTFTMGITWVLTLAILTFLPIHLVL
jgi:hypothetical protein